MLIRLKNKDKLIIDDFKLKCCIGKNGVKKQKIEGDNSTPKGIFTIGTFYYRKDRVIKPFTNLKTKIIKPNIGWCNDPKQKSYNKEIKIKNKVCCEKLFRKDHKYDALVPINYNANPVIPHRGSVIFLHLTQNYKPTAGCIAISIKDFLTLAKCIKSSDKIKIG